MDVQVRDVFEVTGNRTDIVYVHGLIGGEAVCSYNRNGCLRACTMDIVSLSTKKLLSRMVDGKRVERPKAGGPCTWAQFRTFEIGTFEEWAFACDNNGDCSPILNDNGELPTQKPEPKDYVDCPVKENSESYYYTEPSGGTFDITRAPSRKGFMGYVWDVDGKEGRGGVYVLWRDKGGRLWDWYKEGRTLERCKAVRYANT